MPGERGRTGGVAGDRGGARFDRRGLIAADAGSISRAVIATFGDGGSAGD
jgi:hypothetical protein